MKKFIPSFLYLRTLSQISSLKIIPCAKSKKGITFTMYVPPEDYKKLTGKDPLHSKRGITMPIETNIRTILADVSTAAALTESVVQGSKIVHKISREGASKVIGDYVQDKDSKNIQSTVKDVKDIHQFLENNKLELKQTMQKIDEVHKALMTKKLKGTLAGEEESSEDDDNDSESGSEGGDNGGGGGSKLWKLLAKIGFGTEDI